MKVVVVSPHLDDAVLSLGATLHSMANRGAEVQVVTVFAGDPARESPPSYWDARRGVGSAAEATSLRRAEDLAASRVLGYQPFWLSFDDNGYVYKRNPDDIVAALAPHLVDASIVLIPGWPLAHTDHRYAAMIVLERITATPVLLYAELPYAATPRNMLVARLRGRRSAAICAAVRDEVEWSSTVTSNADRAAKQEAIGCYQGEVEALGYRAHLSKVYERLIGRENIGRRRSDAAPEGLTLR